MADSLKTQIDDICRLADKVIKNPSVKGDTITGIVKGSNIPISLIAGDNDYLGNVLSNVVSTAIITVSKLFGNNNDELQREREKRAMLEKVIAKQQAVINKLKNQNKLNRQEIENLKQMNAILQAAIEKLQKL